MDLTISIINMSNWPYLNKCLSSISKMDSSTYSFEVYVVDNFSTDNSVQLIKDNFPFVKIIENKEIRGFSSNHNQVLKIAEGRYILVMNDDTEIEEDTLNKMISFMDNNLDVGIGICKVNLPNGSLQKVCGKFPTIWGEFKTLTIDQIVPWTLNYTKWRMIHDFSYHAYKEVDWVSGVFHFIRKEIIEQIGYYDETFHVYYEDIDYCYRLKNETKYKIAINPETSILHYHGGTMSRKKTKDHQRFIFNLSSCIYYISKHNGTLKGTIFRIALYFSCHLLFIVSLIAAIATLFKARRIRNTYRKYLETIFSYYNISKHYS